MSEVDDEKAIRLRMEAGIRRALNTPPKPTKELVGKTERAQQFRAAKKKSPTRKPGSKD